jgi:high frequency lysogenization protein
MYTIKDKTLALAGIFQAARLVQQIARTGMVEHDVFEASIRSIFRMDVATTEDVFGSAANLQYGFRTMLTQLGADDKSREKQRDIDVTKYVISILVLEKKLRKQADLMNKIKTGIEKAAAQAEHFSFTHENVIASLAETYAQTVSTLNPRILVNGEPHHLQNPDNANKIRALLLAAMRSAVLWHQTGGSRWQILLQRKSFTNTAQQLLKATAPTIH